MADQAQRDAAMFAALEPQTCTGMNAVDTIAMSTAISLRRIADALEKRPPEREPVQPW